MDAGAFFEYAFLCALDSRRCGLTGARCGAARVEKFPMESEMKTETSDFQDYGEDERALGGLLVDVALEVDADFFLDDAPIGFFFGVGLLDGFDDDLAGASH